MQKLAALHHGLYGQSCYVLLVLLFVLNEHRHRRECFLLFHIEK